MKTLKFAGFYFLLLCFFFVEAKGQSTSLGQFVPYYSASFKAVETGFITIPDSVQTSVYWYWLSDNISKKGVVHDLETMKKVGINRAFINGQLMAVVIDDDPNSSNNQAGYIGIDIEQITKVSVRNIWIKKLD